MLLSILFNQQFDNASTNEALCTTTCPACKTQQTLAEATTDQSDDLETIYLCKNRCERILIISARADPEAPLEKGYRIGLWMIMNPSDLFVVPTPTAQAGVKLPACKDALVG